MRFTTRLHRPYAALLATALAATLCSVPSAAGADTSQTATGTVAVTPALDAPRLTGSQDDSMVRAINEMGAHTAAGGLFDTAKEPGGPTTAVENFAIWRTGEGAVSPSPSFDRDVHAIEADADGLSWYVGGKFKTVDGVPRRALVRVNTDGTIDETFTPDVTWNVRSIAVVGDVLYVAGNLVSADGQDVTGLVRLDAQTGALLPGWTPLLEGPYSTPTTEGFVSVDTLDVSDDGTRMVIAGNFATVDGQSTGRVALFDITGPVPALMDWSVEGFRIAQCPIYKSAAFVTDLDIAPSGDWVAISTSGGWGNPRGVQYLCDTVSRFELNDRGSDVRPTWVSASGGDSLMSVRVAGEAVYTGGHQRWMNNGHRGNLEGPGAIEREGISAHDARNGMPLAWNPGRDPRGFGAYELHVTDDGLWVGQDTEKIGGVSRGFTAFMPAEGGVASLGWTGTGQLPVEVLIPRSKNDHIATFTGSNASYDGRVPTVFNRQTGLVGIGSTMLVATLDGELLAVADRGTGAATVVDLLGLDDLGEFEPDEVRGLAYDEQRGELLYTKVGDDALYARGISAQGWALSYRERVVATSKKIDWRDTQALMLIDGVLYIGRGDMTLGAVPYGASGPTDVVPVVVSGPGVDSVKWDRPAGVRTTSAPRLNVEPVADFDVSCEALTCLVDAGDSEDPFGQIVQYRFDAAGSAGTASLDAAHGSLVFDTPGTATVTLVVTDEDGATDRVTQTVTLTAPAPTLTGTSSSNRGSTTHSVTVPAGTTDGSVALLTMALAAKSQVTTPPSGLTGWTRLSSRANGNLESIVWWRPVDAADTGATVTLTLASSTKAQLAMSVWDNVDTTNPIDARRISRGSGQTASHKSPALTSSWPSTVIELWSMRSSTSSDWDRPRGTVKVFESHGVGGGHVSSLMVARVGVDPGIVGGQTATADVIDPSVVSWTIALRTAGSGTRPGERPAPPQG